MMASALWYTNVGRVEARTEALPELAAGYVQVRTLFSGISRGTERLVLAGQVPRSEWLRMRAPFQTGDYPFPVKYGYAAVGRVEAGPQAVLGRTVFCLHPHQDCFIVPADMAAEVPDGVPPGRATLAANMETALNALWDSGAGPADHVGVIGGGIIGLLIGYLAARLPDAQVTLCDIDPARAGLAQALGLRFALPEAMPADCDVVFHTSASDAGLALAIASAGQEAAILELSWYGDRSVTVPLGASFHSRRLRIIGSQVGLVAVSRRARWPAGRRLAAALALLRDDRLDALIDRTIDFADAPRLLASVLAPGALGLPPLIRYPGAR